MAALTCRPSPASPKTRRRGSKDGAAAHRSARTKALLSAKQPNAARPRRRLAIPVADPTRRVKPQRRRLSNGWHSALHQTGSSFRDRDPVGRPDRALRKHWGRIPPRLLGEAQETAALRHQAEPPRRPQCRKVTASISSAISGIFSRPRKPIAAGTNSCANDLTAAGLINRLSADNGTIGR